MWRRLTLEAQRIERLIVSLPARLRAWLDRGASERALADEIRHHVAEKTVRYVESGLSPDEARLKALREFGGIEAAKEQCREVRRVPVVESILHDVRYAARTLRRQPVFAAVAILTLTLGIGANTAVFSLVDAILLRPLPYPEPDRLVAITGTYPRGGLAAMRERIRTMRVAVYAQDHRFNLTGLDQPVRVRGAMVSAELFDILGIGAAAGRTFQPGEDAVGRDDLAVLSHATWLRRFGGDGSIVGRTITLDGVQRQVLGVMPADFRLSQSRHRDLDPAPPRRAQRAIGTGPATTCLASAACTPASASSRRRGSRRFPIGAAPALSVADAARLERQRHGRRAADRNGR